MTFFSSLWNGLLVAAVLSSTPARADTLCDSELLGKSDSPQAYRLRGDRCEGIYANPVSALTLEVRSLVAGKVGAIDLEKVRELPLAFRPPHGWEREVRLRAVSFEPRQHYRMDARVSAARGSFPWPTDVLAALRLHPASLGLLAWDERDSLYFPVWVGSPAAEAEYTVSLIPSKRLNEARITLSRLDGNGKVAETLRRNAELGYGHYPSNKPTVFSLGTLGAAGRYRLTIVATEASGQPENCAIDFDFYHAGNERKQP